MSRRVQEVAGKKEKLEKARKAGVQGSPRRPGVQGVHGGSKVLGGKRLKARKNQKSALARLLRSNEVPLGQMAQGTPFRSCLGPPPSVRRGKGG